MRKLINGKNAVCLYEGKYKDVTYHFFVTTFLIFSILVSHTCLLSLRSEENFLVFVSDRLPLYKGCYTQHHPPAIPVELHRLSLRINSNIPLPFLYRIPHRLPVLLPDRRGGRHPEFRLPHILRLARRR